MEFINKKTALVITILLLITAIYVISMRLDESEQIQKFPNYSSISLPAASSYLNTKTAIFSPTSSPQLRIADNNLPRFKTIQHSEVEPETTVDFQNKSYKKENSSNNTIVENNTSDFNNNVDSSSFQVSSQNVGTVESSHFERNTDMQYVNQNKFENARVEIAKVSIPVTSQMVSNTSSESFIANNNLVLTTDLHNENNQMQVTGNPGDPGIIPVGDGIWLLMLFLSVYSFIKLKLF
ncbi:MAG: hypothetical protein WCG93_10095 [Paludibacter sp.]